MARRRLVEGAPRTLVAGERASPLSEPPPKTIPQLVGRSSSHFTRVAAIYAHELGVVVEPVIVHNLRSLAAADYGGHPALKLPTLRLGSALLFGTENICRRLAALAGREHDPRLVWPEQLQHDKARSAQELIWLAMGAQVQLIIGGVDRDTADDLASRKAGAGLCGALGWLDAEVDDVIAGLPPSRSLSLLEVTLFCLIEHLRFRPTVPLVPLPNLERWAPSFGVRASARQTVYRLDPRPQTDRPG